MLTLTIDPKRFKSPEEAYAFVRDKRAVSVLLRKLDHAGFLHSRRYFYVIEWHKSGWPHWHVLVDASYIPHERLSKAWGLGFALFSAPKFASRQHAANYACKYVIKHPEEGYPAWVLESANVHRYGHSRGLFPAKPEKAPEAGYVPKVHGEASEEHDATCFCEACRGDEVDDGEERDTSGQPRRTIGERVAECGTRAVLIAVDEVELPGGELVQQRTFVAELPRRWDEIAQAAGWSPEANGMPVSGNEVAALLVGMLPWSTAGPDAGPERHGAKRQNEASEENGSSRTPRKPRNPCEGIPKFPNGEVSHG